MPYAWDADALDETGRVIDYDSMEEIVAWLRRSGRMLWKTHDQMRDGSEQLVFASLGDGARRKQRAPMRDGPCRRRPDGKPRRRQAGQPRRKVARFAEEAASAGTSRSSSAPSAV